jgi:ATP-binding cassette subfamily B multidrug efflux pump
MKVFWRVMSYLKLYWASTAVAYVCMLGLTGVALVTPQIIRTVIDQGIDKGNLQVVARQVFLLLGLTAVRGVLRFGQGYLSERVSQGVSYVMRNQMYQKLEDLSFSYHDQAQTGQLLSRATSDVERLRRLTGGGVLGLLDSLVMLVGTTAILVGMQPLLALLFRCRSGASVRRRWRTSPRAWSRRSMAWRWYAALPKRTPRSPALTGTMTTCSTHRWH